MAAVAQAAPAVVERARVVAQVRVAEAQVAEQAQVAASKRAGPVFRS
jgi:hypothetical protein